MPIADNEFLIAHLDALRHVKSRRKGFIGAYLLPQAGVKRLLGVANSPSGLRKKLLSPRVHRLVRYPLAIRWCKSKLEFKQQPESAESSVLAASVLNSEALTAIRALWKLANMEPESAETKYAQGTLRSLAKYASENPQRRGPGRPATAEDNHRMLNLVEKTLGPGGVIQEKSFVRTAIDEVSQDGVVDDDILRKKKAVLRQELSRWCERVYEAVMDKYPQFTVLISVEPKKRRGTISLHKLSCLDVFEATRDWPGISLTMGECAKIVKQLELQPTWAQLSQRKKDSALWGEIRKRERNTAQLVFKAFHRHFNYLLSQEQRPPKK